MRFSVIIPTRDRPLLFAAALASVTMQSDAEIEIIIVNDGSHPDYDAAYAEVLTNTRAQRSGRLITITLPRRANGHGPSYALNTGAAQATGDYLAFLDDDDSWTAPDHLARAAEALAATPADLYMSNQLAFLLGKEVPEKLWLGALAPRLASEGRKPDALGNFTVNVADLIATLGFAHLNTIVVRRALFDTVGGLDETIRWEGDRDFYLRLIDAAGVILHNPRAVARHNIPDPAKNANMTTAISDTQKRLSQLRVVDKAATLAQHPLIRAHGRAHRGYVLAKIAANLATAGDHKGAAAYARSAFGARPSLGGWLTAMRLTARSLMR